MWLAVARGVQVRPRRRRVDCANEGGATVYVQALQRRAHARRIIDCKRLNVVIRYMKRHKCGLKSIILQHPLKLVALIDAAFKAQPEEATGLAFRGLAATLCEHRGDWTHFHGENKKAHFIAFIVTRQRRVVRSTFSAELNGCVNSIEQMFLLQCILHQIYRGTPQSPERMIDMLENGQDVPAIGYLCGRQGSVLCDCRIGCL